MYEDSWYAFVPDHVNKRSIAAPQPSGHRRRESLLQQPNGTKQFEAEPLPELFEDVETNNDPPEPTLTRRAKSYSDFYHVVRAQLSRDATAARKKRRRHKDRIAEALVLAKPEDSVDRREPYRFRTTGDELLEASQHEYLLYGQQLEVTERHLGSLIGAANGALDLLTSLGDSFRAVELQTTTFQAQCDDLVAEEKRLQVLADEVGTDLHYYAYLDGVTRRLNAPGASRLVDHENFGEILTNLDACINFMAVHPTYRDAESYLARYQALLTKALHLVEIGLTNHLNRVSAEIGKQITSTTSDAARHALAYGRYQDMILEADGLIANVQRVIGYCYDSAGHAKNTRNFDSCSDTATNLFAVYLDIRDRDVRPITQKDVDVFKKESADMNAETASRNFIKQCYERCFNESALFEKLFAIDPQYSTDSKSAYVAVKAQQKQLVTSVNIAPIAATLQPVLQGSELQTVCNLLGWVTNEYLIFESDDEETRFAINCHKLTARLLFEHLWPLTDVSFEAEVTKSITKAVIAPESLKIVPSNNDASSSNAHPIAKRSLELLAMYDQAMPKERSQKSSPVVYKIVTETISALQRAEAKLKTNKAAIPEPDPDLFMIKNLLILKNGLLALEIGDVRSQPAAMQHFGEIWETLSPQNWMGMVRGILGGSLSLGLWSSGAQANGGTTGKVSQAKSVSAVEQDASERLDELLRQSIYSFTQRWGTLLTSAASSKTGGSNLAAIEKDLDEKLKAAFGGQPEVLGKLKEAIHINAQAQKEAKDQKK
ncbi:Sec34-like family-domain-containing protein [Microdochium trichocladiopsis]|uniref:Conserved oligomeric Golgi complex subunit 3 n=1 Tax=Microdochium trichocladiopsis TaxID=1682393 RepID=A0A9P8Y5Z3_9PEZI|nr:Sec34-like family-domain-containing protein [Microdochium trichocladiopsis]KAH7029038.1 Sec34-like family-domain-containing protein [Microdochium trichocladiopsis]